jgi:hypothetical protein
MARWQSLRPSEADFHHIAPRLDLDAHAWLRHSLAKIHPGHVWLSMLDALYL